VRVVQSERDNLDLVEALVKENKLDVDFWRGELFESEPQLQSLADPSALLEGGNRVEQEDVRSVA